jgi:TM2 domain-containing membrane protein YozV
MKREYVGLLFLLITVVIILGLGYLYEQQKVENIISRFIIIWLIVAYYVGQYSMRFPKRFGKE